MSLTIDTTVKDILTSRVYDVAVKSPLERASKISMLAKNNIYLKREDLQPVHSFKLRGAYNKMVQLDDDQRSKGVITASAGNHAQGVALAAKKLGISALIIMPRTTPSIKVDAVKSYGAQIELEGDNYSEAADYCKTRIEETGRTYIHPFDDPLVIAGQGTIGREIIEQLPETTHIFVPVGGGGLIAGIANYVKTLRPDVKIISVEPEDSCAMKTSHEQGERVTLSHVGIFADGVAVKQVGSHTFTAARTQVDDFITVNTDQLCAAIKHIFEDTRSIVEPAGALAVAGIMQYDLPENAHAVAICSGANISFERLQQVAERTLIGSGQEALFAVTMPEKPGAFNTFYHSVVHRHNVNELNYRFSKRDHADFLVGLRINDESDKQLLKNTMTKMGYLHTDLSDDDIAKEHIRHIIGGKASNAINEHIYEVTFPERPGALGEFLATIGLDWNISLFHYRSAASDSGRVLIGFEAANRKALEIRLKTAGFEFTLINDNRGLDLFVRGS